MSAERAALLAAVTASPDDTTPRLVYADWLDEYAGELAGDERAAVAGQAEAVRLAASTPGSEGLPDCDARKRRNRDLERAFAKTWLANVPKFARPWVRVRDGLPLRLEITGKQFLKHGKRLRREVPYTAVRVRNCAGSLEAIINAGLLAGVHELDLAFNALSDGEIGQLSRSPDVASVRDLDVAHVPFSESAAEAFARSVPLANVRKLNVWWCSPTVPSALAVGHFRQLRELHIGNCGLDVPTLRALVASPSVNRLEALELSYNTLGVEAGEALAHAPRLAELRRLGIANCQLFNLGLEALSSSSHLRALESVAFSSNGLGPRGIGAFARSPMAASVRALNLENNSLDSDAMVALSTNAAFRRLERLELGGVVFHPNNVGAVGLEALVTAPFAPALRDLDLYSNERLGPAGARVIAAAESLHGLERLDLGQCGLGPDGGIAIGGAGHLANLQYIRLVRNGFGPQGMKAVVAAPWLATVRELYLSENYSGAALEELLNGPHLDRLEQLTIHGNRLSPDAGERFKARLGDRVQT